MKVSIIVPVYNSEKYLRENIESLINQSYKNIEIIFINDGSTDESYKILKEYSKKYTNIFIFEQENKGQSSARNFGLQKATGQYIMFVDSDDYIASNMIEKMLNPMIENKNIDVTFCDYYLDKEDILIEDTVIKNYTGDLKKSLIISAPSPCLKLFKSKCLKKFKFPENMIYEDLASIPLIIAKVKSVYYVKERLYYYRQHINSVSRSTGFSKNKLDILRASQYLLNNTKNNGLINYKQEMEFLIIQHLVLAAGLRFVKYPHPKEKLKLISDFITSNNIDIDNNIYYKNMDNLQKQIIKIILKNNVLKCYMVLVKRKLRLRGYNEI